MNGKQVRAPGHGWAVRARDLWWILAAPVYLVIGTIRHEGSHLVVGLAQGAHLVDFSALPSDRGWGYVLFDGGDVGWQVSAAPYVCDLGTFAIGYAWAFRIPSHRRSLFSNVFAVALLSPLVDSVNNYLGVFYPWGDVGHLAQVLGATVVHISFITVFFLYATGIARVLTRTPVAISDTHTGPPRDSPDDPPRLALGGPRSA